MIEFTYNNSYQATIGMEPYKALHGRKCHSLVCWDEIRERKLLGPKFIQITTDKMRATRERMKEAYDRQKSSYTCSQWMGVHFQ